MADDKADRPQKHADSKPDTSHLDPWKWKKGQSGNPGGRLKGSVSLVAIARRQLREHPELAEEIVREWIRRSMEAGGRDLQMMLDRLEGPIAQILAGSDGGPIEVALNWQKPLGSGDDDEDGGEGDDDGVGSQAED